jgi:hypothetical protein
MPDRHDRHELRFHAAAAFLLSCVALTAMPPGVAKAVSFTPADDGSVNAGKPQRTYGKQPRLMVGRAPARVAYLKFVVRGLSVPPRSAALRLRALSPSGRDGIDVRPVSRRRWTEARLTWRSAPRRGRIARHHRRYGRGWITLDVTPLVRGNAVYTFALTTKGRRTVAISARESGASRAPRLVIDAPESVTRPPGSTPLSDALAAAHVRPAKEIRPANTTANHTVPTPRELQDFRSASKEPYTTLVSGDFIATTDEIIQWAAWKWGIDEDIMRAVAVQESWWSQSEVGDGGVSFGIFQVKTQLVGSGGWPGTYPLAKEATAFNADYFGRALRSCYDGRETWLGGSYHSGDLWGCVGWWYSGNWNDAQDYVSRVKKWLAERAWEQPGFY